MTIITIGTRFLKRGVSLNGKVANDVDTEQILQLDGPYDSAGSIGGNHRNPYNIHTYISSTHYTKLYIPDD